MSRSNIDLNVQPWMQGFDSAIELAHQGADATEIRRKFFIEQAAEVIGKMVPAFWIDVDSITGNVKSTAIYQVTLEELTNEEVSKVQNTASFTEGVEAAISVVFEGVENV